MNKNKNIKIIKNNIEKKWVQFYNVKKFYDMLKNCIFCKNLIC